MLEHLLAKIRDGGGIADGAVTTAKIAGGAVTTAKIFDSNITTAKINDGAVTTAKIANAQITDAKLSNSGALGQLLNGRRVLKIQHETSGSYSTGGTGYVAASDQMTFVPLSATSHLMVFAFARGRVSTSVAGQVGANRELQYHDGSSWNGVGGGANLMLLNNTGGTVFIKGDSSQGWLFYVGNRNTSGNWAIRLAHKVNYANNTVHTDSTSMLAIEFEV